MSASRAGSTEESSGDRPRILVIDDDRAIVAAFSRLLRSQYEVVGLTDAREALRRIAEGERFDVILCDLFMPRMDGIEFYGELRAIDAASLERVVFLSGGAYTDGAQAFLDEVPNRTVAKPFSAEQLLVVIRSITSVVG